MPSDQVMAQVNLLVDFANSYDVEDGTEDLGTPAELAGWLAERDLLPRDADVSPEALTLARELRTGFRKAMAAHHDGTRPDGLELTTVAAKLPLRLTFDRGEPRLVPTGDLVDRALGALLVAAEASASGGAWHRLKLCAAANCQVAYYDTSKNQSRTWCSMAVCGNRQKTRSYRRRQARSKPTAAPD
ncbi:MAG TPA: CGNR zinc finger domain-containing protein [Actinomycetes bacterium]|nr:CGNR zinc finger domain-containing protein [Actinomycetes bacterium]